MDSLKNFYGQVLATIGAICTLIFSSAPTLLVGSEIENDPIFQAERGIPDVMIGEFDELEVTVEEIEAVIQEVKSFLHAFIDQLNARYMTEITLEQICQFFKENLNMMQISPELRDDLLEAVDLLLEEGPVPKQLNSLSWVESLGCYKLKAPIGKTNRSFCPSMIVGTAEMLIGSHLIGYLSTADAGNALLIDGMQRASRTKEVCR